LSQHRLVLRPQHVRVELAGQLKGTRLVLIKCLIRHHSPLIELLSQRRDVDVEVPGIGTRDVKPPLNAPGPSQSALTRAALDLAARRLRSLDSCSRVSR